MSNADESGLNVNNSSKEINNPRSSSTNHQTSSSSEISSDSEPEIIEKPVFQKPKDPAFSIPSDYVLQSVEDLAKDVKVSLLGKISQVFDKYVVIRSTNSAVVLNERSVLFLEDGKYLGEVYETFGPVRTPFYLVILSKSFCVPELKRENQITSVTSTKPTGDSENVEVSRTPYEVTNNPQLDVLNSLNNEENQSHNESGTSISDNNDNSINDYEKRKRVNQSLKETPVFYAPDMPELTIPVFYNQLISNNIKGSDASWVGDMEPPPEALEFSDDEQEKLHKRKLRMKRKSQTSASDFIYHLINTLFKGES
ncbi:H/ACA ribonucleoprotein complex non-core subunit NAF1 [Schistosoma japonicum]|nr:H/ACA ribonucleoprotein complex non-core subunit NAF1 [Schistosoma japonicum]